MPMTPLPSPAPSRADPTNFAVRGDALLGALPVFVTEANVLQTDVNAKQVTASAAASAASASQAASVVASNVTIWVTGTTYAIGDCRFSPTTFSAYRRKTAGAGATDPASDGTNWVLISQMGEAFGSVTSTAVSLTLTAANFGQLVKVTATAATITLPAMSASPAGSAVSVSAPFATGTVTLKGTGAELLASQFGVTANTLVINAGEAIQLVSNGTSWETFGYEATVGVTAALSDNSTKLATMAALQAGGVHFPVAAGIAVAIATTLTAAQANQWVEVQANVIVTLPTLASLPAGATFTFKALTAFTLKGNGAETIGVGALAAANTYAVLAGQTVTVVSAGSGVGWYAVMDGFGAKSFASSLAANGYETLPTGRILQWGSFTSSATSGNSVAVTFPIAFPSAFYQLTLAASGTASTAFSAWYDTATTAGFNGHGSNTSAIVSYMAIGK